MEATSHIGLEARTIIRDNLPSTLVGVDVGMNRHRSHACSRARFSYKTDIEVDSMSNEDAKAYAKHSQDGWFDFTPSRGRREGGGM